MARLENHKLTIAGLFAVAGLVLTYLFGQGPLGGDPMAGLVLFGVVLYGFHNLTDILGQRANDQEPRVIVDAARQAMDAYNADIGSSFSLFVTPVTEHSFGVQPAADGELQGFDQWGRPLPRRFPPKVNRQLPLFMAGDSIATNFITQEKMTVQEVNDRVEALQLADMRWMRRQFLSSVFQNTAWTFTDPEHGPLTVSVFANNDAEAYMRVNSGTASADTHHKGYATLTEAVLQDLREELIEHPENAGQVVVFVPTASKATVQGFANHVDAPDTNVTPGTATSQYVGNLGVVAPGTPIGYNELAQVHLREWPAMPDNYLLAVTSGGMPAVAQRQDPEASLQGFREIPGREDTPYLQRMWMRRSGFGAFNRVGAVVARTNSATYAPPVGFAAPN